MLSSEIKPSETLLQQLSECNVYEQVDEYPIDCYPYATRGILWGILFCVGFWVIASGVLILVF